jgi:hypothetical protein
MSAMGRALTRAEIGALATDLWEMLRRIEGGQLDATATMRHRIEGAIAILDVVQGRSPLDETLEMKLSSRMSQP